MGELIHGKARWATLSVPKTVAKTGAFVEAKAEPLVPDDFDHGEKPFIRPFMIDLANDHYELDTTQAREQLGWVPKHRLFDTLPALVENLKQDPLRWYNSNGITPPDWLAAADEQGYHPERVLAQHQDDYAQQHAQNLWAHFINIALGLWLITSPSLLGY
ncbi:MAG: DNA polymerase III subunit epsilon, partial [Natronospirillum sp.]